MDSKTKTAIKQALDSITLSQVRWDGNEDVMTFNNKPIGMTVRNNLEIQRWWSELKEQIKNEIIKSIEQSESINLNL